MDNRIKDYLKTLIDSGFLSEEKGDISGGHLLAEAKAILKELEDNEPNTPDHNYPKDWEPIPYGYED